MSLSGGLPCQLVRVNKLACHGCFLPCRSKTRYAGRHRTSKVKLAEVPSGNFGLMAFERFCFGCTCPGNLISNGEVSQMDTVLFSSEDIRRHAWGYEWPRKTSRNFPIAYRSTLLQYTSLIYRSFFIRSSHSWASDSLPCVFSLQIFLHVAAELLPSLAALPQV